MASPTKTRKHTRTPAVLGGSGGGGPTSLPSFDSNTFSAPSDIDLDNLDLNLDPDDVFTSMSVTQVRQYQARVEQAHHTMSGSLRNLISERYTDMLGTASTIVGMSESSESLCAHLSQVQKTIQAASTSISSNNRSSVLLSPGISRSQKGQRRASLRVGGLTTQPEFSTLSKEEQKQEADLQKQHAIYAVALELKLLLDAPEHMWRCVEKGHALRAAWIWVVARSAWWDLQAVGGDGKDQVKDHRRMDVLTTFPFAARQWSNLAPMRKQIVTRATELLAYAGTGTDGGLSFTATVSCLQTVILLDNLRLPSALTLFLSQRSRSLRSALYYSPQPTARRSSQRQSSTGTVNASKKGIRGSLGATSMSLEACFTLSRVVRYFLDAILFSLRAFLLPSKNSLSLADDAPPHLTSLLQEMMRPAEQFQDLEQFQPQFLSSAARSPVISSARRRSSVFGSSHHAGPGQQVHSSRSRQPERLTAYSTLAAFPSSNLLLRYLPSSVLSHTPYIDLEGSASSSEAKRETLEKIKEWASSQATFLLSRNEVDTTKENPTHPRSFPEWIESLNSAHEVGHVQQSLRATIQLAHRAVSKALGQSSSSRVSETRQNGSRAALDQSSSAQVEACSSLLLQQLESLQDGLEQLLARRLQSIYLVQLSAITSGMRTRSQAAVDNLSKAESASFEHDALSLLFSSTEESFSVRQVPKEFTSLRSPAVAGIVLETEQSFKRLRRDMKLYFTSVPESSAKLEQDYLASLSNTCSEMVQGLESLLKDVIQSSVKVGDEDEPQAYVLEGTSIEPAPEIKPDPSSTSKPLPIEKALLVGHIALALRQSQPISRALSSSGSGNQSVHSRFAGDLERTWERSVRGWREDAIQRAARTVDEGLADNGSALPESPSSSIVKSLSILAEALHSLGGISPSLLASSSTSLLKAFVPQLISKISIETSTSRHQKSFDLKFVRAICERNLNSQSTVEALDSTIKLIKATSEQEAHFSRAVLVSLSQQRLLFAPLLTDESMNLLDPTPRNVSSSLLLAPPPAGKFQHL